MKDQYDPKRFIVRERYKFWSDMGRKPGETIQELAARIRQDAATCDFSSIKDSQNEAMRTRFICFVKNKAVLKAIFKVKDDDLDFTKAINIASETEEAAKVAKQTMYGTKPTPVNKVRTTTTVAKPSSKSNLPEKTPGRSCYRCGNKNHDPHECRFKESICDFYSKKGHLEAVCLTKQKSSTKNVTKRSIRKIYDCNAMDTDQDSMPKLEVPIQIQGKTCVLELDTATPGNFISRDYWKELGSPALDKPTRRYESASNHEVPVIGTFVGKTSTEGSEDHNELHYNVTETSDLNLLGRTAMKRMGISVDAVLNATEPCHAVFSHLKEDMDLQDKCRAVCKEFPDLWKPELGCLKDFELEVKFKENAEPVFRKSRPVPFSMEDDLEKAYEEGTRKGIWEPTKFNDSGTPVVPVKKVPLPGQEERKIRVCGGYSATVNPQLEDHRHPLPLPEDLMRKLGGGYGFSKIDLADAYNQVRLGP